MRLAVGSGLGCLGSGVVFGSILPVLIDVLPMLLERVLVWFGDNFK